MFEEELELEKKESSLVPMLLIFCLVAAIVGTVAYFVMQARQKLVPEQAAVVMQKLLDAQGPAVTHFHAGLVKPSVDERPEDPHYTILTKAGVVNIAKAKNGAANITLTPEGEKELASFPELKKVEEKDGTTSYTVPLAERALVKIDSVTMQTPTVAKVEYEWNWKTNKIGDYFDASSDLIKGFKVWDRQKLIDKYGADFYHGDNKKAVITLVRDGDNWRPMMQ